MQDLGRQLRHKANALGFSRVGIIPAQPARRLDAYTRWLEAGMHGRMAYMARPDRISRRQDLNVILPGVQSLICVGLPYFSISLPPHLTADPSRGRVSNYAWGVDYHDIMLPRLQTLADWLAETSGTVIRSRVYVDTGAILERDHAETAGLGFTGKNTMLIDPRYGSYFFLGEILTTLPVSVLTSPEIRLTAVSPSMPTCGRCTRCLDACPTDAFPQPYVLDARRCISYLTIELKEWIPAALRPSLGNWIYGCDICQEVCPFNRFAAPTQEPLLTAVDENQMAPPLLPLLTLDEAGFNHRFARSPIKRLKRTRFLRNVCVAVGNWGSPTAVSSLTDLLADPEPLIRGHAAWALHQINTPAARRALQAALPQESDPAVRQEIQGNPISGW